MERTLVRNWVNEVLRYCKPTSVEHFPGWYTCVHHFDILHIGGGLFVEPNDSVGFEDGEIVITQLGQAMRRQEDDQRRREARGEVVGDMQGRFEAAILMLRAATIRIPLAGITRIGSECERRDGVTAACN